MQLLLWQGLSRQHLQQSKSMDQNLIGVAEQEMTQAEIFHEHACHMMYAVISCMSSLQFVRNVTHKSVGHQHSYCIHKQHTIMSQQPINTEVSWLQVLAHQNTFACAQQRAPSTIFSQRYIPCLLIRLDCNVICFVHMQGCNVLIPSLGLFLCCFQQLQCNALAARLLSNSHAGYVCIRLS